MRDWQPSKPATNFMRLQFPIRFQIIVNLSRFSAVIYKISGLLWTPWVQTISFFKLMSTNHVVGGCGQPILSSHHVSCVICILSNIPFIDIAIIIFQWYFTAQFTRFSVCCSNIPYSRLFSREEIFTNWPYLMFLQENFHKSPEH